MRTQAPTASRRTVSATSVRASVTLERAFPSTNQIPPCFPTYAFSSRSPTCALPLGAPEEPSHEQSPLGGRSFVVAYRHVARPSLPRVQVRTTILTPAGVRGTAIRRATPLTSDTCVLVPFLSRGVPLAPPAGPKGLSPPLAHTSRYFKEDSSSHPQATRRHQPPRTYVSWSSLLKCNPSSRYPSPC